MRGLWDRDPETAWGLRRRPDTGGVGDDAAAGQDEPSAEVQFEDPAAGQD